MKDITSILIGQSGIDVKNFKKLKPISMIEPRSKMIAIIDYYFDKLDTCATVLMDDDASISDKQMAQVNLDYCPIKLISQEEADVVFEMATINKELSDNLKVNTTNKKKTKI